MTAVAQDAEFDARQAIHAAEMNAHAARVRGAAVAQEKAEASERAEDAHERSQQALQDKVLGREGAGERYRTAIQERQEALAQVVELDEEDREALRLRRGEEERIRQIKIAFWDELRTGPEEAVAEVRAAAEQLVGPLRAYLAAWSRAEAEWAELAEGTREQVLSRDRERGNLRDSNRVRDDAALPACPVSSASLLGVLNVLPRPRMMAQMPPVEPEDDGVVITDAPPPARKRKAARHG